jgi:peptide-methionine (S)-S-oxide reductase
VPGVIKTRVGYTGGDRADPNYGTVCNGDGHTEALKIDFDPSVVSFAKLLDMFMAQHDPCVPMTTQYQSAVWPQSQAQADAVVAAIERVENDAGQAGLHQG